MRRVEDEVTSLIIPRVVRKLRQWWWRSKAKVLGRYGGLPRRTFTTSHTKENVQTIKYMTGCTRHK